MSTQHSRPRQNVNGGRKPVTAHQGVASVGHDGGRRKKTFPTSDRNVAINARLEANMTPRVRADAGGLVGAKIITPQ